jgi:hypothetical protein
MPRLFEVRLKEIYLEENGYWEVDANVLGFTLLYPREAVPGVATTRTIKLPDRERVDFPARKLKEGSPYEELLFREVVRREAPLLIEVTAVYKADWIAKAFVKAIGVLGGTVVKTIPAGDGVLAVLGSSVGSIFDQLTPKDKPYVIGRGLIVLQESMADGLQTIPLSVPKDVKLWKAPPPQKSMGTAPPAGQEIRLPKGEHNGTVTVQITSYAAENAA